MRRWKAAYSDFIAGRADPDGDYRRSVRAVSRAAPATFDGQAETDREMDRADFLPSSSGTMVDFFFFFRKKTLSRPDPKAAGGFTMDTYSLLREIAGTAG